MSGIPMKDISTGGMPSISQSNLELEMQQLADLSVEDFLQLHGRRWHERVVQLHHTDAGSFSTASHPLPHTYPTRRRLQRTRSIASGHSSLLCEHQGAAANSPRTDASHARRASRAVALPAVSRVTGTVPKRHARRHDRSAKPTPPRRPLWAHRRASISRLRALRVQASSAVQALSVGS
jgi:hypothetical protein